MDMDIVKRFICGAKEAYKKVSNHSFNFPITIESAYRLATNIEKLLKEKEQEPKQVGLYGKEEWLGLVCVCPDCKAEWMSSESETHFCPNCGQAVK